MSGRLGPRFGAEAAFLIAVAIVLGLLEVSWAAIVAGMFAAWLVVAGVELALARRPARSAEAEPQAPPPQPTESAAETVRVVQEPARGEPAIAPAAQPATEERPAAPERAEPVPVPAAERTEPGAEPEPEAPPEDVAAAPPPPPVLTAVAPPAEPVAEEAERPAEPEPEPEPSVVELRPGAPREWNLWELERLARARAGEDPVRDEEWSYLLMYLREFATADGSLPRDFDGLVRESFGDALSAAR